MTASSPGLDRCPRCAAAVRPGDPWCTLCYADLRPAPPPPVAPPPVAPPPVAAPAPSPPPETPAGPTWPCASCGTANRLERDACAGCGAPFLAGLRDQDGPLLELPVVGDLAKLGRGQRLGLAGGVVLAFVLVTLLIGVLLH